MRLRRLIVGALAAQSIGCASAIPPTAAVAPGNSANVRVRRPEADLAAQVTGIAGAPVLLALGGGPGYSHDYMDAFRELARASAPLRVVTYDPRGTGSSRAAPGATFALEDTVGDVEAVRIAVGAPRMVLLGHSYGALVAEAYALRFPDRVRALVLVDAMPDRFADLPRAGRASRARADALRRSDLYREPAPSSGDDCSASMNGELAVDFADPRHPAAGSLGTTTCSESTAARTFRGLGEYDLERALGTLQMPVLLVFGEADPEAFELDVLRGHLKAAPVHAALLPACGHYPFLECRGHSLARCARSLRRWAKGPTLHISRSSRGRRPAAPPPPF